MTNEEKERRRMVDDQLVGRGIKDERVLDAMRRVPRHEFLPEAIRGMAYADNALPIGECQTMSQPYMVAIMTELLDLTGTERVLEIGTGSGYQAAVLAELCSKVYTVERIKTIAEKARATLDRLGYQNVAIKIYDGTYGWKEMAPFDAIMVTAGAPEIPAPLVEQLKDGGRMVIPVGERFGQSLLKVIKTAEGTVTQRSIPCVFVPLIGNHGWKE
ncbi:MAG TPA: protein-L-isoaspartate(D-aspartate) O-methyltransferase [Nitrospirota bacterium]|nr:protein-L-isoaspartate(D-aspartate) O-methyltransferase [Nitrospirota bacterium]